MDVPVLPWVLWAVSAAVTGVHLASWRSPTGGVAARLVHGWMSLLNKAEIREKAAAAATLWSAVGGLLVASAILVGVGATPVDDGLTPRHAVTTALGALGVLGLVLAAVEHLFLRPRSLLPRWMRDGAGRLSREVIEDRTQPW